MSQPLISERVVAYIAEQRIQRAIEAGEFDKLPGMGEPIPDLDQPYDELWWVKKTIRREGLSALTKEMALRKTLSQRFQGLLALPDEAAVRAGVEDLNRLVSELNAKPFAQECGGFEAYEAAAVVKAWRARREAPAS
ncbi:MAG: DUF1992 domain-containing protein [Planctomycetes bacterium]|nr:DUF1992 domain-containing protein [Planctomycetota bacterium]